MGDNNPIAAVRILPSVQRPAGRPRKQRTPKRLTINKRLKTALELMVFGVDEGPQAGYPLTRAEAAQSVGMLDHSLRQALRKPHVRQYYNGLCQVLRTSERPKSLARIAELRDVADSDSVRFRSAVYLDKGADPDELPGRGNNQVNVQVNVQPQVPGYVIAIPPEHAKAIEADPDANDLESASNKD